MRKKVTKSFIQIFLLGLISLFITPNFALAQEKINDFNTVITAQKDGTMVIEESINYDFGNSSRHGIFRFIPLVSRVGDLYRVISVDFEDIKRDGKDEEFSVDNSSKKAEVKIGNPDKTITGAHTYYIKYKVTNGIGSNYSDHDEIYLNVTGNDWQIPIQKASVIIKTDFGVSPGQTDCFTGVDQATIKSCQIEESEGGKKITSTSVLNPYEGLTFVTSFPVDTFPKSTLQKNEPFADPDFINFLKFYIPAIGLLNLILGSYLLYWYFKNKRKTRFGKPAVNFDIPKDNDNQIITPAEASIIDNAVLDKQDVIATTFDLAIRKFIKIEEIKTVKALRPDETDYKIIKLKPDYSGTNAFEKQLLHRYFRSGDEVKLSDLKLDFYKTVESMEDESFQLLKQKGFYTKNPKTQMTGLLILGIAALATLNIILGPILIFLSRKLNGRTQLGDEIDWKVDGLKIFLKSMSRHYKWQTKNLVTVEKYIPYAIALGLQKEFMDQLKIINPEYKPSWYSGSHNFYHSYPSMFSSMNTNITTVAPSSSSGFSGGSSGGGGGGGGGGSW